MEIVLAATVLLVEIAAAVAADPVVVDAIVAVADAVDVLVAAVAIAVAAVRAEDGTNSFGHGFSLIHTDK